MTRKALVTFDFPSAPTVGGASTWYVTPTGTNASGSWGISVTGNAGTVTNGVYTTGDQNISGKKVMTPTVATGASTEQAFRINPNVLAGSPEWRNMFNIQSTYNAGANGHGFYIKANASNQFEIVTDWSTHLRLGVITNGGSAANATAAKYLALTTSAITWDGNALLDAVNYTTYTVTKTGTGASGTWGISISGTAAAAPWSGITGKPTTLSGYGITDGELRHANGVPRSNLGDPTVREMAVFDAQFGNKTDRTDIANVTFETSTDGTTWTSFAVSDANKRYFVGGDITLAGIGIPNGTAYFRIKFRAVGYSYLNALYSYFSTNGNTTKVTIYKKHDSGSLEQHTNSATDVSSWPGHLYLPFTTIPFHATGTLGTHYHEVYVVFQPTWINANTISLYNMSWWGGYPAGRRNLYTTDEFGNAVFPAAVSGSTAAVGTNTTQLATTAFVNAEIANDAPTKTGGGASGTWGIGISGNAATASNATQFGSKSDSLFVFGDTASGSNSTSATQNVYELAQYKSGFWDANSAAWTPDTGWWWGATFAHRSNSGSYNFSGQLAFQNSGGGDNLYARTISNGTPTGWSRLLSSGNYAAYTNSYFGSPSTGGTLDWNHVSNTKPGASGTLLLGSATNGMGDGNYYHPFNIEYSSKDGTGNVTQMAVAYSSPGNELYMRGRYNGSWSSWVRYLNSNNFNSYAPTLTGTGASGTWPIGITGNAATVTDYNSGTKKLWSGTQAQYNALTPQSDTLYYITDATVPVASWTTLTDKPTTVTGFGITDVYTKTQSDVNYPTKAGVGATGTWGISITGNAATVTNGMRTNASSSSSAGITHTTVVNSNSAIASLPNGVTCWEAQGNGTGPAVMTFHRPSAYAGFFGLDTDNKWKVGGWSMGANSYEILHAGNYTTYSPSLTGSGASGTWGISVTGNAATVTNGVYTTGNQSIAGDKTFSGTTALASTSTINGAVIGYRDVPVTISNAATTFALADAGKAFGKDNATAYTYTIPANGTVAFPVGTVITVFNNNATSNITVAITTDTLRLAGTTTTGSRTVAPFSLCTLFKVSSTVWMASGAGVT